MKYLSVCSGIEAATVAWHPLGWQPAAFSEIEPFPCSVLAHHYPTVPNLGDMTKFKEWKIDPIDLFVGGTPCQSFSVAGLRKGLDDPRGNLMLTYLAIANQHRPRWLVWENVPGVLSSNHGKDFGTFLGGLGELGYGFAYRVLDAQYFGVAQRRRRVFVIGCLGDWRSAAAVLFEQHSLQGNPAPRRQAGKGFAPTTAPSLTASGRGVERTGESRGQDPVIATYAPEIARCVATREGSSQDWESTTMIAHSLRGEGFDASEDGTGRGTPLVPVGLSGEINASENLIGALDAGSRSGGGQPSMVHQPGMQVRRLTPIECERLQGFTDNYTYVPHRGKPAADGPRYKALGNSMAVPVMNWIGRRIDAVDQITRLSAAA